MDPKQTDSEIEYEENGDFTVTFSMTLPPQPSTETTEAQD